MSMTNSVDEIIIKKIMKGKDYEENYKWKKIRH